jgi:hypothetical protein
VNPASSPVIAHGYARPLSLLWNGGTRELWLSGSDPRWAAPVSVLRVDGERRAEWPWVPSPVNVGATASQSAIVARLLALSPSSGSTTAPPIWVVQEDGVAQRITGSSGRGVLHVERVQLDRLGRVIAIAESAGRGGMLVATETATRQSQVWRLSPRDTVP